MNIVCVAGLLGGDAQVKYLNDAASTPVANFSVADDQGREKPTIWWNCQLFGKRAESLSQYLTKGQKVTVTGQLAERKYTDKDGQERVARELRVDNVALQGSRQQVDDAPPARQPANRRSQREQNLARQHGSMPDDDLSDVPF